MTLFLFIGVFSSSWCLGEGALFYSCSPCVFCNKLFLIRSFFYLVFEFKKIIGNFNSSDILNNLVNHFKKIGYDLSIMWQTELLSF